MTFYHFFFMKTYMSKSRIWFLASKIDPRTERIFKNYNDRRTITCIQINQKEPPNTFRMISNWKKTFGLHGLYKHISAF